MPDRPTILDRIDLTPAMIEAGGRYLYRFHTGDEPGSEFREAAEEVFAVMLEAADDSFWAMVRAASEPEKLAS